MFIYSQRHDFIVEKIKRGVQRQSRDKYVYAVMVMVPASRVKYVNAVVKPYIKRTITIGGKQKGKQVSFISNGKKEKNN